MCWYTINFFSILHICLHHLHEGDALESSHLGRYIHHMAGHREAIVVGLLVFVHPSSGREVGSISLQQEFVQVDLADYLVHLLSARECDEARNPKLAIGKSLEPGGGSVPASVEAMAVDGPRGWYSCLTENRVSVFLNLTGVLT